ncbi:T-cell immunomodulatory protein-like [Cottoperca gobio]|uniref:T-cell immunomodulatory protein-like n=1 Tax=Cottoperca gobio TaxID=56716 RepID=A0A6J2P6P3_COTGO|nr:T-cell immunomodulatory protein-like [Cottoperca gobio]
MVQLGPEAKGTVVELSIYGNGYQDHLLPVCLDAACQRSAIYLAKSGSREWVAVLLDFQWKDTVWSFVPAKPSQPMALHFGDYNLDGFPDALWVAVLLDFQWKDTVWSFVPAKPSQPMALHFGDYNLDGFPDALVVLRNTTGSGQHAFLLENVPCNNASCHSVGRMFHIHWDQSDLGAIQNAVMATFFDIYEDGILDMLVLSHAEGKNDLIIHALKNNFEADAYFVKVMDSDGSL